MAARGARTHKELNASTKLTWSAITMADLTELSGLLTAIEHLDEPIERHSLDGLQEEFTETGVDPKSHAVLGRDAGGTLVAYGWNHVGESDIDLRRVYLAGGVHPGWRSQGIGRALLGWQLNQARSWYQRTWQEDFGPLRITIYVDERLEQNRRLIERMGLRPFRWYADMNLHFEGRLPAAAEPEGIQIVPFTNELSEGVRNAHNEAFADHWGAQPVDKTRWDEQLVRVAARPKWSWVALDGATGEVAGYAMNSAFEQDWEAQGFSEGWTDRIGVRQAWRGRGIAEALLRASMQSFRKAGMDGAGIGVDSDKPAGAFNLYESLGYQAGDTVVMYALTEAHN